MNEAYTTRRQFLVAGMSTTAVALAGCDGLASSDDSVEDSDGDGVIDSEDYAPRDPEVQRREQLVDETPPCDTDTPTASRGDDPPTTNQGDDTPTTSRGTGTGEFSLDFEDPPEAFRGHTETVGENPKLVLRGEEIEYPLPDLRGWQRIEYKISGGSAGNTKIAIRSSADGGYSSFVGIRPWMRWSSAVEGFDGARTYPDYEWEDVQPDTEYRVVIDRTGGATGRLTVHGPGGNSLFSLPTETVFNVYEDAEDATFRPDSLFLKSNRRDEQAVFDDISIR